MASYLILTPPGGFDRDHARTRFVRDGFSFLAFLLPVLWLLWHRQWLAAVAALLLQGIGGALMSRDGFGPAGFTVLFGTSLLAALEGKRLYADGLIERGWTPEALVSAPRLANAEDMYFAEADDASTTDIPTRFPDIPARPGSPAGRSGGPAIGLIGYDGGR